MPWGSWNELPTEFDRVAFKRELGALRTAVFAPSWVVEEAVDR
jgi:hypothetical protein